MAVSARESAAAQDEPAGALARPPDPRAPGWGDVREMAVFQLQVCGVAVTELTAHPGGAAALEVVRLNARILEKQIDLAERLMDAERKRDFDEEVLESVRRRAFDEGFAAGQALRGRLSLVSSG